jgi:AraC-like DNA-binding protein
VTYCFAGLSEYAVPVLVGGQHIATLLGGQIFQQKPSQTQFEHLRQQLRVWGMQRELQRIKTAFFQTHVLSRQQFQASLRLLIIFARFLAEDANRDLLAARLQDQQSITQAKNFILTHAREPLYLHDVAEHVHVSTYYFSKVFKKATGIGFSEFLTRTRVEFAKKSLANPVLPINEVATQAGFGSLSQFNRAFQRYAGCTPKQYRASLLQKGPF